jgi:predicted O-linked N-acetylglucosamine transferase (SPINDLY family)
MGRVKSPPRSLQLKMQQAVQCHQRGDWQQAQTLYEEILSEQPGHFDALHLLGVIAAHCGDSQRAVELIDKALEIDAHNAVAHFNRGTALQARRRWHAAVASYDKAIANAPAFAEAYCNRGVALTELKDWHAALASCNQALAIRSRFAEALFNRGNVHRALGHRRAALADYDHAISIRPDYAEAFFNRGNVHREVHRPQAALADYDRAIACRPGYASAHFNRGNLLRSLKRWEAALESYRRAAAHDPDLEFLPGEILQTAMMMCDWRDHATHALQVSTRIERDEAVANPFVVLALSASPALQLKAAQIWVRRTSAITDAQPTPPRAAAGPRIRIGYFSADYHDHATAHLIAGLFEAHDASRFQVCAFSYGPDSCDGMRQRLRAACESFLEVREKSDAEVAQLARSLEIDIAIDLKGYTEDGRTGIFASRAAPLQVNYLGYPGTMGAEFMDYLIADRTVVPEEAVPYYAEKIIFLPHSYQVNDRSRAPADATCSRAEAGLPAQGFVFCCFNNAYKITPETFERWMRILRRVQGSVLWLLEDDPRAAENLRRAAVAHGVGPERLIFAARIDLPRHLARHRAADLFLDTLPYNAHTTASDALWAGLPVLTCPGASFASRVAASLLQAIDMPELITATQLDYENLAVRLATQPQWLSHIKQRLTGKRLTTPLFDVKGYARHIEGAYAKIHERYHAGLPAMHLYLEAGRV